MDPNQQPQGQAPSDQNLDALIAKYQQMVKAGAPPEQTEALKAQIMQAHGGSTNQPGTADQDAKAGADLKARMATGLGSLNTTESDSMKKVIGLMSGQVNPKPEPKAGGAELQVTSGEARAKPRKKKKDDDLDGPADRPASITGSY